jgi:hypothetical protein
MPEGQELEIVSSGSIMYALRKDNPRLKPNSLNHVGKVIALIARQRLGYTMPRSDDLKPYETRQIGSQEEGLFVRRTAADASSLRWGLKPLNFLEQISALEQASRVKRVRGYTLDVATKLARYSAILDDYLKR